MENNEKSPPEGKRLKLDLREALTGGFDDDDDIIELKDEVTLPLKEEETEVDLDGTFDLKFPDDEPVEETVIGLDTLDIETDEAELEKIVDPADELTFEEEDESEADEEIQTHLVEKSLVMDDPDEVVEITEFDDILSEDDNEMITLADEAEELEAEEIEPEADEEEFLELIDVEEDSFPKDEKQEKTIEIEDEIIQFDGIKEDIEDVELEDFINDSLTEEIRIDDDLEDDLTSSLGVEAGSEMKMVDQVSEAEDLDFNIDSSEISEKIDQLDTIFFDDTEAQTDFEDEMVSDDEEIEEAISITGDTDAEAEDEDEDEEIQILDDAPAEETMPEPGIAAFAADQDKIEESIAEDEEIGITDDALSEEPMPQPGIAALAADHDKLEESIERIIQKKYSKKIESMVVEVIEKAVSKEIDRLKNILLEDNSPESS